MGKFNEIQDEKTQSWGGNSFTTTVKEDTVEFDSAKDKFTFKDEVEVPALKVNGEPITPAEPQQQADWNQNDNTKADYIKNRICYQNIVSRGYSSNDADAQEVYNEWDEKIGWYTPNASITEADALSFIGRNLTAVYEFETVENTIESYSEPFGGWFGLKQISTNVYAIYSTVDDDYIAAISLADGEEGMLGFETLNKGVYFSAILESYNMDGISEYVTLDDNYISSNIARVSDIKQSDWNQNDSSAADFIKNRIAYVDSTTFYDTDSVSQYFNWDKPLTVSNSIYIAYTLGSGSSTPGDFIDGPLTSSSATQDMFSVSFSQGALFYYPAGGQGGSDYNGSFSGNPFVTKIKVYEDNSKKIDTQLLPTEVLNNNSGVAFDATYSLNSGTYIVDFSKSSSFLIGTVSANRLYIDCSNCANETKYEFTFLGLLAEKNSDTTVSRFIEVHNASNRLKIYSNIQSYTTNYYYNVKIVFMKGSSGGTDMMYVEFTQLNMIA